MSATIERCVACGCAPYTLVAVQDYSDPRDGCFGRRGEWHCAACSYTLFPGNRSRTSRWFEANYHHAQRAGGAS